MIIDSIIMYMNADPLTRLSFEMVAHSLRQVYIYICVYMYILYMCVYFLYTCVYICICIGMYICMLSFEMVAHSLRQVYVYVYVYIYVRIYYKYVYTYVSIYVYMYVVIQDGCSFHYTGIYL
jgi:hypothetical protein